MINISEKAKNYIRENGSVAYIMNSGQAGLCCGKIELCPTVQLGTPKNAGDYDTKTIEDIKLYIPKGFYYPHPLTIELNKMLGFRSLTLNGWKLL